MSTARTYDRIRSLGGGMDGFRPPSEIDLNQSQYLENVIIRDNFGARTRAGADQLDNTFMPSPSGAVQGLAYFDTANFTQLLAGIGGKIYSWNGAAWSSAIASFALHDSSVQFTAAQGVDKLLLTDGFSSLQVWDGTNFTSAGAVSQFNGPIGVTSLCWHAGRMFASGQASNPDTVYVSNRLTYGAGDWDSVKRSFRVGDGDGEAVVALASLQNFNLAVLKENSVWLVQTDPRAEPADYSVGQASERVAGGQGCVGRNAFCVYQNDVLFMSQDGVQSLQRMQAAAGQYQLSAPLSLPIQPFIDRINWSQAGLIVGCKYRHLAIFFVPLDISTFNNYALVWNGRLGQWTGVFTGWTPSCSAVTRFNNVIRLVMGFHDGTVNQWKDQNSITLDATYLDNGVAIPTKLHTRAMVFGNPDMQKKLKDVLSRFNAGKATITISVTTDLTNADQWTGTVQPSGDILPAILPFKLASFKPITDYRSLEGLSYCNEAYINYESTSGWWELRNVTARAFLKPVDTHA